MLWRLMCGVTRMSWLMQQHGVVTRDVFVLGEMAAAVRLAPHCRITLAVTRSLWLRHLVGGGSLRLHPCFGLVVWGGASGEILAQLC